VVVRLPGGRSMRISGTPAQYNLPNTKVGAKEAEIRAVNEAVAADAVPQHAREAPTLREFFQGQFWREWVLSRKNSPSEQTNKMSTYEHHLGPAFGHRRIDQIKTADVAALRAKLLEKELSVKAVNNILAILSTVLHYAVDAEIIEKAPKVSVLKYEPPEVEFWEFADYARLLEAAKEEGPQWLVAVCLAGEAGLRVGEVRGLRWSDVDLVAGTITVAQQLSNRQVVGPPKGRRRRSIPMTATLDRALRSLEVVRTGYVVRDLDGEPYTWSEARNALRRISERAGLPASGWHALRHSYGTHLAMLGVNPWRLQSWLGHTDLATTQRYTHVADAHARPTPGAMLEAAAAITDPDRRVLAMLGARGTVVAPNALTG
jgi:integrase